jgi:hypothetical protein
MKIARSLPQRTYYGRKCIHGIITGLHITVFQILEMTLLTKKELTLYKCFLHSRMERTMQLLHQGNGCELSFTMTRQIGKSE